MIRYETKRYLRAINIEGLLDYELIYDTWIRGGFFESCQVYSETHPDNHQAIAVFRPKRKT